MSNILRPENLISVIRGTSKTFELEITDDDGAVVDLTGATLYFTVKAKLEDTNPLIQKKSSDALEIDIYDPRGGKAKIYLNPSDTQTLALKPHIFDVWVVLSSGKRYVVVGPSTFELKPAGTVIPV